VKTFIVDESKTVSQITQEIAEKIGLANPEEFSLQQKREDYSGKLTSDVTLSEGICREPQCVVNLQSVSVGAGSGRDEYSLDTKEVQLQRLQCK
jgi:hypothetical protein